jgi:hypothetical protein
MSEVWPYEDDDLLEELGKNRKRNPKPRQPAPTEEELAEMTKQLQANAKASGRRDKGDGL